MQTSAVLLVSLVLFPLLCTIDIVYQLSMMKFCGQTSDARALFEVGNLLQVESAVLEHIST